jgi:hypothetical protein
MKHLKIYEYESKYINFSDLVGSGNMSATYHVNKSKGLFPYVKENGIFRKINIDDKESIPRNAIWLKPEQISKYNELAIKIIKLKEEQKNILDL